VLAARSQKSVTVGLFCPYSRSLLTLVWSAQACGRRSCRAASGSEAQILKSPICTVLTYIHVYMFTDIHTCLRLHTYMYTCLHTYIYILIHTYIGREDCRHEQGTAWEWIKKK